MRRRPYWQLVGFFRRHHDENGALLIRASKSLISLCNSYYACGEHANLTNIMERASIEQALASFKKFEYWQHSLLEMSSSPLIDIV